jgi:hypothetical protein
VNAWNPPRNQHAQGVLRQDGERGAYLDIAELGSGSVTNRACQFVAVGGRIAVIVSGTWKNGTVKRWSVNTFPPQLPLPTANLRNVRVLRSGKLALR